MEQVKVSIIIIGYNVAQYIEECLNSAFLQNYSAYEVIYVDDGSTDNTIQKIERYQEYNNFVLIKKENGGIVSARKAGLKVAKGEYVVFIDGDDWIDSNFINSILINMPTEIKNIDIVCSKLLCQNRKGDFKAQECVLDGKLLTGEKYLDKVFSAKIHHEIAANLFRKKFLLDSGYLSYPDITVAEDLMTCIFLGLNNPTVYFHGEANYYYRYNNNSVIRSGSKKLYEHAHTLEIIEEYFKQNNIYEKYKNYLEFQWFYYMYIFIACRNAKLKYSIKYKIAEMCREKTKNFKSNDIIRLYIKNICASHKCLMYGYYYVPWLMCVVEPIVVWGANLKYHLCK